MNVLLRFQFPDNFRMTVDINSKLWLRVSWLIDNKEIAAIAAVVLGTFVFVIVLTGKILGLIFPTLLVILLQLIFARYIISVLARAIVFPGCTGQWTISIEYGYGRLLIRELIKFLGRVPALGREASLKELGSTIEALSDQKTNEGLTEDQAGFLDVLIKLGDKIVEENFREIDQVSTQIKEYITRTSQPQSWLKSFLAPKPPLLGSMAYMRSQVRLIPAKIFCVDSRLDCALFEPRGGCQKVVLFCNPNAGYFETLAFQTDWLEVYSSLGYAFCSWNYRGYGRSRGFPSVGTLAGDARAVLAHLRGELGFKNFAVHARSIGGVAVSLGFSEKLDFLVADRTFASLRAAARDLIGRPAAAALWIAGEAGPDIDAEYLEIPTAAKLVIFDSDDEIIADSASLKEGIANRMVERSNPTDGAFFKLTPPVADAAAAELRNILETSIGEGSPREGVPLVESAAAGHCVALAISIREVFGESPTGPILIRLSNNWQVWGVPEAKIAALSALDASLARASEVEVARSSFTAPLLPRLKPLGTSKAGRGELLRVKCGHNGSLTDDESRQFADAIKRLTA